MLSILGEFFAKSTFSSRDASSPLRLSASCKVADGHHHEDNCGRDATPRSRFPAHYSTTGNGKRVEGDRPCLLDPIAWLSSSQLLQGRLLPQMLLRRESPRSRSPAR